MWHCHARHAVVLRGAVLYHHLCVACGVGRTGDVHVSVDRATGGKKGGWGPAASNSIPLSSVSSPLVGAMTNVRHDHPPPPPPPSPPPSMRDARCAGKGTQVAYVSRTEYPEWAVPCLQAFMLTPTVSMWALGAHSEIYPGSKRAHFKEITRKSGVPYEEMVRRCAGCGMHSDDWHDHSGGLGWGLQVGC